jgi:uncharacterized protein (DUF1697 family)
MKAYVVLLRGVNVGGTGTISIAALKKELEKAGFTDVATYINSGNVILKSDSSEARIKDTVETVLSTKFKLGIHHTVLVLSASTLASIVKNKPKGFGDDRAKYYSDVIFLMGITVKQTMPIFRPKEGVDTIWAGKRVVYSQRLGSMRTKSRLNKIMSSPLYKSMTIRTWGTVTKLLALIHQ